MPDRRRRIICLFILVEMQRLVEGLGNEEEGGSGFEVPVGKGRKGAQDRIHLSAGSGSGSGTSVKFASMLEVLTAARAGFSGAWQNRGLTERRNVS